MGDWNTLVLLVISTIPVTAVALLYARREYRERGKLTVLGLFLLCAMLFLPNLVLEYATDYQLPTGLLDYIGIVIGGFGLVLCLVSVTAFRSIPKVLCLAPGKLTIAGPYRWSRNPQYVGWFLFLLGFALNDWSLWCLAALSAVAIGLHLLVLIEEEHLLRVFGDPYLEYCRSVPRYAGWRRSHAKTGPAKSAARDLPP